MIMYQRSTPCIYKRKCAVCSLAFETTIARQNICSFKCRQEATRVAGRVRKFNQRKPCVVCGWSETTDVHHDMGRTYILCPNHHALITRGLKTIEDLLLNVDRPVDKSNIRQLINHIRDRAEAK
jgi:hypothetical protein